MVRGWRERREPRRVAAMSVWTWVVVGMLWASAGGVAWLRARAGRP